MRFAATGTLSGNFLSHRADNVYYDDLMRLQSSLTTCLLNSIQQSMYEFRMLLYYYNTECIFK